MYKVDVSYGLAQFATPESRRPDCQHSWFIECRRSDTGAEVRFCKRCGTRAHYRSFLGEDVYEPMVSNIGSLGNCLFNVSQITDTPTPLAQTTAPTKENDDGQAFL